MSDIHARTLSRRRTDDRVLFSLTAIILAASGCDDENPDTSGDPLCNGTASPLDTGPTCCGGVAVIRPQRDHCDYPQDLSPNLDSRGRYQGSRDRPNYWSVGANTLQVCAAHIIDNGEGENWPHGPYGNIHLDMFAPNEPLHASPDRADRRRMGEDRILRGPHRTHGDVDEWLDDEVMRYDDSGLVNWGENGIPASQVVLRLRESDGSEDGNILGRRDDVLGMELIDRSATEGDGVWVEFHKYDNGHPRVRTGTVAVRVLLKTGGRCP